MTPRCEKCEPQAAAPKPTKMHTSHEALKAAVDENRDLLLTVSRRAQASFARHLAHQNQGRTPCRPQSFAKMYGQTPKRRIRPPSIIGRREVRRGRRNVGPNGPPHSPPPRPLHLQRHKRKPPENLS